MLRKEKGITLIALVVTIIVLLILAAVGIAMLTGENGILAKTKDATILSKIKEVEEVAKVSYMSRKVDEITEGQEITFAKIINDLKLQGYTIEQRLDKSNAIKSIVLSDNEVKIGINSDKIISYTILDNENTSRYFVEINQKYYEIEMNDKEIIVNDKSIDLESLEGFTTNEITIQCSKDGIIETQKLEDDKIKITTKEKAENIVLTVSCGGKSAECNVIIEALATGIEVTPEEVILGKGATQKITVKVTPTNTTDELTMNIDNPNIATITETGEVTGVNEGTANITITCGSITKNVEVKVVPQGSAATITSNMIGKTVTNYTMGGQTWEILYADTKNIYLITHSCVSDPIYKSKNLAGPVNAGTYSDGSSMFEDETRFPSAKKWLYAWFDNGYQSKFKNMQATLFMLDSKNVWNDLYKDSRADYAIGGPTPEMIDCVWGTPYGNFDPNAVNEYGYGFGIFYIKDEVSWVLNRGQTFWIAMASGGWTKSDTAFFVYNAGKRVFNVNTRYDGVGELYVGGFRPVVCLNTNTILEINDDGKTYRIK